MTASIDMQRVADMLRERGFANAYVEQTGGGCATLYAGPTREEEGWGERYAVAVGPGWFDGPGWSNPKCSTSECWIGPDGNDTPGVCPCEHCGKAATQSMFNEWPIIRAGEVPVERPLLTGCLTCDDRHTNVGGIYLCDVCRALVGGGLSTTHHDPDENDVLAIALKVLEVPA